MCRIKERYRLESTYSHPARQADIAGKFVAGGRMAAARASEGPATPPQGYEAEEEGFGGLFAE